MKKSSCCRGSSYYLYVIMAAFVALCITSCKDEDKEREDGYNPSKPIVITDFAPKKGGFGGNLILYGDNFGNDPTKIKVTIGGEQAKIVAVKNTSLYCIIPGKAYDGDIKITVYNDNDEEIAYAAADTIFEYEKKWLVTTLIGTRYENSNDKVEHEGSFDNMGVISKPFWFSFDPKSNFDHLYLTTHDAGYSRLLNLQTENVTFLTQFSKADRPAIINWTVDNNADMILSRDLPNNGSVNVIYSRASDFTTSQALTLRKDKSLTGSMVHPINGEIYYTTYYEQEIWRYDIANAIVTTSSKHLKTKETTRLVVNPTGKFAYMTRFFYDKDNSGYIARMDYIESEKRFAEPYIIAGTDAAAGYEDGVGNRVRMKGPAQGVFVYNPEYADEKEEDRYDFYFCDSKNHCIRVLTPSGRVYTYAGRAKGQSTPGSEDGDLREESRFNTPTAITYDEKRKCFYVGDTSNGLIRKIGLEE